MKRLAFTIALLLCAGCASTKDVTNARVVIQAGTNRVEVSQNKDTTVGRLEFDPATGHLVMERYASTANAGAVEASRLAQEGQSANLREMLLTLKLLGVVAGKTQGLDLSSAVVPKGFKLVPVDDPSTPQQEVDP